MSGQLFETLLVCFASSGDTFSQKVVGFFVPPYTTNYTFYVAGDDGVDISLSTTELEANCSVIAYHNSWNGCVRH